MCKPLKRGARGGEVWPHSRLGPELGPGAGLPREPPSLKDSLHSALQGIPRREVWAATFAKVVNLLSHKLLLGVLRAP